MDHKYRESSIIGECGTDHRYDSYSILVIESDGMAYRRFISRRGGEHIDVSVTGSALDYELRRIEAIRQMYEFDKLAREGKTEHTR